MISLGGGMPNPDTFPFDDITVTLRGDGRGGGGGSFSLRGEELESVLQYSPTRGQCGGWHGVCRRLPQSLILRELAPCTGSIFDLP